MQVMFIQSRKTCKYTYEKLQNGNKGILFQTKCKMDKIQIYILFTTVIVVRTNERTNDKGSEVS